MKTYITEYHKEGILCGDRVQADSWQEALQKCYSRRQDEVVVGILVLSFELSSNYKKFQKSEEKDYILKGKIK